MKAVFFAQASFASLLVTAASSHDEPRQALVLLQTSAESFDFVDLDDDLALDLEDYDESTLELLQVDGPPDVEEDADGCDPPKRWVNDTVLHDLFTEGEIRDMVKNGTLESRENPEIPDRKQHSVKKLFDIGWMSEAQVHERFDSHSIERMLQSGSLQTRRNPRCPQQTQYYKVHHRVVSEAQLYKKFGKALQDLITSGIVEPTRNHAEYFLHPKLLKGYLQAKFSKRRADAVDKTLNTTLDKANTNNQLMARPPRMENPSVARGMVALLGEIVHQIAHAWSNKA